MFKGKLFPLVAVVTLLFVGSAMAQGKNGDLAAEIATLKSRLAKLESQIAEPASSSASGSETYAVESSLKGIKVSGSIDSIYSYNFNKPGSAANVGRVFDRDSNSFNLNAAKLSIEKAVAPDQLIGFRADLYAGNDAEVIHSSGLGEGSDSFDLEQAYVEVNLGTSKLASALNDVTLKAGKFVTLAGAEVIESKDNWNTSRSFLFGYAIPFTHTGLRATYVFDNKWDLALGINNGWDATEDSNEGKTLEAHLGINGIKLPADSSLNLALQGYFGRENNVDGGGFRNLGDMVATYYTPWKPLTLMYNFDYAHQADAFENGDSAKWYGHAGYAKLDLSDDWSLVGRAELFEDSDGVRIAGVPATYREFTGTLEYRPWKGLITRFEYRNDHADEEVFNDDSGSSKNQNTLSGEIIYSF